MSNSIQKPQKLETLSTLNVTSLLQENGFRGAKTAVDTYYHALIALKASQNNDPSVPLEDTLRRCKASVDSLIFQYAHDRRSHPLREYDAKSIYDDLHEQVMEDAKKMTVRPR